MGRITQHSDDPDEYIWIRRAETASGKSRSWIEDRCDVFNYGRRNYVKIVDLNKAIAEDEAIKPVVRRKD